MSTEADELEDLIRANREVWATNTEHREMEAKQAAAILAAGYRKPRTITTLAELDKLPPGSVILDPVGLSLHRNPFTGWNSSNGAKEISAEMLEREALPAIVLHTPEVTR